MNTAGRNQNSDQQEWNDLTEHTRHSTETQEIPYFRRKAKLAPGGKLCPPGDIWKSLDTFWGCHNLEDAIGMQCVEAGDAVKHSTMSRTAPKMKNLLDQNVIGLEDSFSRMRNTAVIEGLLQTHPTKQEHLDS